MQWTKMHLNAYLLLIQTGSKNSFHLLFWVPRNYVWKVGFDDIFNIIVTNNDSNSKHWQNIIFTNFWLNFINFCKTQWPIQLQLNPHGPSESDVSISTNGSEAFINFMCKYYQLHSWNHNTMITFRCKTY